ncbi:MAG TPA: PqqD family protein [Pyrinomonadaceae bacterium]|nr:PqqD family protein [Pyrinomonadaceae bacterium]
MAISFTDRVKVQDEVLISGLQGESVILNLNSERYFGLDEVGTRFLTLLSEADSIQAAYDALLEEYEVEPEVLRRDLTALLDELVEQGLVKVSVE